MMDAHHRASQGNTPVMLRLQMCDSELSDAVYSSAAAWLSGFDSKSSDAVGSLNTTTQIWSIVPAEKQGLLPRQGSQPAPAQTCLVATTTPAMATNLRLQMALLDYFYPFAVSIFDE